MALGQASEGLPEGGRLWGASFLEPYLFSHPIPALRPVCLCFACLKWLRVDPGMGLIVLDSVRTLVGHRKEEMFPSVLDTVPGCAGGVQEVVSWESPELGVHLFYPHPTLPLLACFLLCVQCLVSVLSWQLWGPRRSCLGWHSLQYHLAPNEG